MKLMLNLADRRRVVPIKTTNETSEIFLDQVCSFCPIFGEIYPHTSTNAISCFYGRLLSQCNAVTYAINLFSFDEQDGICWFLLRAARISHDVVSTDKR